jgi:Flp pilus assembly secretin CpaC
MRRLSLVIAAALTLSGVSASAQMLPIKTASADLPVAAGQASYLNLGGAVRDVVVGDPSVADVSVVNERTLVVLGKRPGVTSLLAFSASGRALADRQVVVSEGAGVTVYRGAHATAYACGVQCTRLTPEDGGGAAPPAPGAVP